jgi:hypothetical protein
MPPPSSAYVALDDAVLDLERRRIPCLDAAPGSAPMSDTIVATPLRKSGRDRESTPASSRDDRPDRRCRR